MLIFKTKDRTFGYTIIYPVVVVAVNIYFQTKKNTLVIGHCIALAVIATKTLAGKS